MSTLQTINKWVKDREDAFVIKYISSGRKASGNWQKDLSTEVKETGKGFNIKFIGSDYTYYLVNGRRKNKKQDDKSIRAFVGWAGSTFLKDWVEQKNIAASPYAVAYKIARKGIEVPNRFNEGDLISGVINDKEVKRLTDSIVGEAIATITTDLKKLLNGGN